MKQKTFNKLKKALDKIRVVDDLLYDVRDELLCEEVQMISRHMSLQDTVKEASHQSTSIKDTLTAIINVLQEESNHNKHD